MVIKKSDDNGFPQKRCWDKDERVVSNEDDGYYTEVPVMEAHELVAHQTEVPRITGILRNPVMGYDKRYIGEVYGHAGFPEGEVVKTSETVKMHILVETKSGSFYLLEDRSGKDND